MDSRKRAILIAAWKTNYREPVIADWFVVKLSEWGAALKIIALLFVFPVLPVLLSIDHELAGGAALTALLFLLGCIILYTASRAIYHRSLTKIIEVMEKNGYKYDSDEDLLYDVRELGLI